MSNVNPSLPPEFAEEVIPILDFGPYIAGEKGSLVRLGSEIRYAQENVGFYFAINHGVPRVLIDRAHANLRRFFALPDAEKKKHKNYLPPKSTIYVSSTVNENTKPDLNEMLRIQRERAIAGVAFSRRSLHHQKPVTHHRNIEAAVGLPEAPLRKVRVRRI